MTEKEKMQAGLWFNANFDPALCAEREQTAELCQALNSTPYTSKESRKILLARLAARPERKGGAAQPLPVRLRVQHHHRRGQLFEPGLLSDGLRPHCPGQARVYGAGLRRLHRGAPL